MVLHLLGKKCWNIYNHDNVERVKRDEAAAAAREEERDRITQEQDALRRTALLRGEAPPTFAPLSPEEPSTKRPREDGEARLSREERKQRRRLRGEDETDHAIRIAKQQAEAASAATATFKASENVRAKDGTAKEVDIVDHAGHIQLFAPPDEKEIRKQQKNAEHEAEKKKKEKEFEDQYTMRFSNAAGFSQNIASAPWYANAASSTIAKAKVPGSAVVEADAIGFEIDGETKNVWGRPDPARKERQQARASTNDPFAFMQQAQGQLRQAEIDREMWKREKEREMEALEKAQREARQADKEQRRRQRESDRHRHERRHERHDRKREESIGSLEGFSLGATASRSEDGEDERRRRHRCGSRHEQRHGRSREGERERNHRSSTHEHRHRRRSRSPR
ncbi:hypothetical protein BDV97DRAFT_341769 [Delphinella strobiligena]|nr:hypothetical protein BDV97DRAFT_341769 [Delphinella strobiligena]